jgi:hypothetical protein
MDEHGLAMDWQWIGGLTNYKEFKQKSIVNQ